MPDVLSMEEVDALLEAVDKPLKSKLVIEPGKFYRTRGGHKVRVYAVDAGGHYPVHGAALSKGVRVGWEMHKWQMSGSAWSPHENPLDLIAPWADPPEVDWDKLPNHIVAVAMEEVGIWYGYLAPPHLGEDSWVATGSRYSGMSALLRADDYPVFSGDWRDSLAVRPGWEGEKSE